MKWLNASIREEIRGIANNTNLSTAEKCIDFAKEAFESGKKDEYEYWLALAGVYCKLIIARKIDDN